jgi:hypothetical protein
MRLVAGLTFDWDGLVVVIAFTEMLVIGGTAGPPKSEITPSHDAFVSVMLFSPVCT